MKSAQKTNRRLVLLSIMLAMFMSAIEGTIVATAMPSIVAELGGFSYFSWVFSAFLLAQAVTIPIYGKLAEMAETMTTLITFRLIQGIGAGAVQPIATTIIGDIFSLTERAKVQGYTASVWGISAVIGPALGAIFVQYLHWSWIFWVNIPLGILSIVGMKLFLHESIEKRNHEIDYVGSALIFVAVSSLMIILIQGGVAWPWLSLKIMGLLAVTVIVFILFIRQEQMAKEPIMPLSIWRDKLITLSNLATLTTGIVMIGVTTFVPTFVQGVLGQSPLVAGFALAFMSIGWPIASSLSGSIMLKYGFRITAISGGLFLIVGSVLLLSLKQSVAWYWVAGGSFLIGVGMGLTRTVFIVAIQNSVDWQLRGVATASNMFMSILGNTIGAGLLAGILNSHMLNYLSQRAATLNLPVSVDLVNNILDPEKSALIPAGAATIIKEGLALSIHSVFWGVLAWALVSTALVFMLPTAKWEKRAVAK